jgi:hypothetical protein
MVITPEPSEVERAAIAAALELESSEAESRSRWAESHSRWQEALLPVREDEPAD